MAPILSLENEEHRSCRGSYQYRVAVGQVAVTRVAINTSARDQARGLAINAQLNTPYDWLWIRLGISSLLIMVADCHDFLHCTVAVIGDKDVCRAIHSHACGTVRTAAHSVTTLLDCAVCASTAHGRTKIEAVINNVLSLPYKKDLRRNRWSRAAYCFVLTES